MMNRHRIVDTELSRAMRWRVAHRTVGYGHLYQGRFKSFPEQSDEHLLTVLRYIGRLETGPQLVLDSSCVPVSAPLLEQRREAGLLVVMIACQCLLKTLFLHHHE